jgi:cytosine/adenosine deaminase-related metal-dependent hydrolase
MRIIKANKIFTLNEDSQYKYIVIDDDNYIKELLKSKPRTNQPIENYNGLIVPGFFNAHCHLELSHLKGKLQPGLGLPNFISSIGQIRNIKQIEIQEAISQAYKEMVENGIVFVGDICNSSDTFDIKQNNELLFYNFIEAFGLNPQMSTTILENCEKLAEKFGIKNSATTPHSPYSVSQKLFELIKLSYKNQKSLLSIHNQETESENDLYLNQTGDLFDKISKFAPDIKQIGNTGKSSIQSYITQLDLGKKILFVHNSYTSIEDINYVNSKTENAYWCVCPNSNLYIDNKLTDFEKFKNISDKIMIGTDSLASNTKLDILSEIKTILKNSNYSFEEILNWACINPAKYFGVEKELGSIEVGKKAKLNLISDFKNIDELKLITKL